MDKLYEKINNMAIDIAQIKTKFEMMPPPAKQPCQWHNQLRKEFDSFVLDKKQTSHDWRVTLIRAFVDIAKMAIVAGAGVLIGLAMKG